MIHRHKTNRALLRKRWLEFAAAVLLPVLLLMLLRTELLSPNGESDPDSFYHAAVAERGPAVFTAREFPQTTLSVWQERFSDKELGFHFLLRGIQQAGKLAFGQDSSPPFHVQSLVLLTLFFAAVAGTLNHFGIRQVWVWTTLIAVVSPQLAERLVALRPHLLAMTLFVLAIWCFSSPLLMRGKRRWPTCFLAGMVFGYCYSNPHFIVMPAGAYAAAAFLADRDRRALLLPFVALAGTATALLLHPQFPNSFLIWKIQSIDVTLAMQQSDPILRGGSELTIGGRDTLRYAPFLALFPLLAAWIAWERRKLRIPPDRNALFTGILALGTAIGMCFYFRMMEYGVPSLIIAAAVWIRPFSRRPAVRRIAVFCLLGACLWSAVFFSREANRQVYRPEYELADWLRKQNVPPGTVIGHLSWGDFPKLYYAMPEYRFLCGLDPMFAAGRYRKPMLALEDLRRGIRFTHPHELSRLIGSRWLWVSKVGEIAATRLYLHGYVPAFEGPGGWLFKLDEPLHAGKPEGVPRLDPPAENDTAVQQGQKKGI